MTETADLIRPDPRRGTVVGSFGAGHRLAPREPVLRRGARGGRRRRGAADHRWRLAPAARRPTRRAGPRGPRDRCGHRPSCGRCAPSPRGGRRRAAIDDALREAVSQQLMVAAGDHYSFRHALGHEAVYGDLPPGRRRVLHHRVAVCLTAHPELALGDDLRGRGRRVGPPLARRRPAPRVARCIGAGRPSGRARPRADRGAGALSTGARPVGAGRRRGRDRRGGPALAAASRWRRWPRWPGAITPPCSSPINCSSSSMPGARRSATPASSPAGRCTRGTLVIAATVTGGDRGDCAAASTQASPWPPSPGCAASPTSRRSSCAIWRHWPSPTTHSRRLARSAGRPSSATPYT